MKVFERDGKVNFVDENNVFLGYDIQQDCCENAGYSITDTADRVSGEEDNDTPDLSGFVFDTLFFQEEDGGDMFDMGGTVTFRIVNGESEKFIHLYNAHNGYYGHGFEFKIGDCVKHDGVL